MSNGPIASTLVFLSSLPSLPAGSKVRFLGCVTHYALASGTLTLQHAHSLSTAINAIALVDVTLLLEGLKREDMEVGAWVNVIGYVEDMVREGGRRMHRIPKEKGGVEVGGPVLVKVKAIMLWSAGGVKVGEYERVLEERIKYGKVETR